jgi:hypothetical protein
VSEIFPILNLDSFRSEGNGLESSNKENRGQAMPGSGAEKGKSVSDSFFHSDEKSNDDYSREIIDKSIQKTAENQGIIKKDIYDKFTGRKEDPKDKENKSKNSKKITPEQEKEISELEKRDHEVKTHENAHKSAGGSLVHGAAAYSYTTGPDGKQYAIGGEVKIDMSYDAQNPRETIQKMEQVKRAALAPAEPSAQDRSVASAASDIEQQAGSEIRAQSGHDAPKNPVNVISKYKKQSMLASKSNSINKRF